MEETTKAYLADLLDGEGSIGMINFVPKDTGRPRVIPFVTIGMHSKKAIEFFAKAVGKNIHHSKGSKGVYQCRLTSWDAVAFLDAVLPYLITKKPQALFFNFMCSIAFSEDYRGGGSSVPSDIVKLRITGAEVMRLLNQYDDAPFNGKADELSERLSLKMQEFKDMVILSQATEGVGSVEGATTRETSPNSNSPHERPPLIH